MAECIIAGRGSYSARHGDGDAVIRVTAEPGDTVTCTNQINTYSQSVPDSGLIEFYVNFGVWTVSSQNSGKSRTVEVDVIQLYNVVLSGVTYGITINMSISDPDSAVTYTDDAVGFSPLYCNTNGSCDYGSWKDIIVNVFGVKPCLYRNRNRLNYLNPDNYALLEGGGNADITSGNGGDVMIEFKKTWYKFYSLGNVLTFQVANYDRSEDGFVTSAFYSEDGLGTAKDYFYYGAYDGYNQSGALRSLSGKTPTVDRSYDQFIQYASSNASNCTIETLFKRYYILGLLMLVTKGRDQQTSIGHGRVNSNSSAINTGTMNTNGLFYGRNIDTAGCKVFGIENFWGNIWHWMAGLVTLGSGNLGIKQFAPYSAAGGGYQSINTGFGTDGLIPTKCGAFASGAIMLPTQGQSDTTKGWPDYFYISSNSGFVAYVGGGWANNLASSGPFRCDVSLSPVSNGSLIGARLLAC